MVDMVPLLSFELSMSWNQDSIPRLCLMVILSSANEKLGVSYMFTEKHAISTLFLLIMRPCLDDLSIFLDPSKQHHSLLSIHFR